MTDKTNVPNAVDNEQEYSPSVGDQCGSTAPWTVRPASCSSSAPRRLHVSIANFEGWRVEVTAAGRRVVGVDEWEALPQPAATMTPVTAITARRRPRMGSTVPAPATVLTDARPGFFFST